MLKTRVIPVLLYQNGGLYKSFKFKDHKYVGDPINAIRIFNEKEVDELIFLDIEASKKNRPPDYDLIRDIASECFMPLCYGGGVTSVEQMSRIFELGVEKISLNHALLNNKSLVQNAKSIFGSQSVLASVDVDKDLLGRYHLFDHVSKKRIKTDLLSCIQQIENAGIGEIFINAVYRDGMMNGYDVDLVKKISSHVQVPLICCGGAGNINDFKKVIDNTDVSAVAAGSMFVFYGKHKAVLITYPEYETLEKLFNRM